MTTLVQKIIDGHFLAPKSKLGTIQTLAHAIALRRLNPQFKQYKTKDGWKITPSPFGGTPQIAERYVFKDHNPGETIENTVEAGHLDYHLIFRQARMPVDTAWLEWKITDDEAPGLVSQVGVLIDTTMTKDFAVMWNSRFNPKGGMMIVYISQNDKPAAMLCVMLLQDEIGSDHQLRYTIPWHQDNIEGGDADQMYDAASLMVRDTISLLFLLTTPRATEIVKQEWSPQLQKARARRGKFPLLEYRQVTLTVGAPRRVHVYGQPVGPASPRRLHQVVGHWRTYLQGRAEPHITWVPQHWRGDPKLGIVAHDRTVKIPSKAAP